MRITIIEDNIELSKVIALRLQDIGHSVNIINTGLHALDFIKDNTSDLVILDINLPYQDGLSILQEMRIKKINIPVLLLTARTSIEDRVRGLDIGADDYLIKPFSIDELEARIRVLLRRHTPHKITSDSIGHINYDFGARVLTVGAHIIELPRRELMLFECLISQRGRLLSKSHIAEYIFGLDSDHNDKSVETYISRLRKRLTPYHVTIKVARGLGYMLCETSL